MTDERQASVSAMEREPEQRYVFVTTSKRPFSISRINRAWKRVKAITGIVSRFRIHDCRRTPASVFVQTETSLFDVGQVLGHKDQRSTRRYAHLAPENHRSAMQNIERWKRGNRETRNFTNPVVNFVVNEA
jgi:integrase